MYNEKRQNKHLLASYLIVSVLWSAVFTLPVFFTNHFGWDESQSACWFNPIQYSWIFYAPMGLAIAASCVVTFRVVSKLRSSQQTNPFFHSISDKSSDRESGGNPFRTTGNRERQTPSQLFSAYQARQAFEIIEMLVARLVWYVYFLVILIDIGTLLYRCCVKHRPWCLM